MSKTGRENYRRPAKKRNRPNRGERHITVRSVRREPVDLRKLGRVAITLAMAEAEAEKTAKTSESTSRDEGTAIQETAHDD